MLEDRIDLETKWIVARSQADTCQLLTEFNSNWERYRNTDNDLAFDVAYYEALVSKLCERSALTTQARRGTKPRKAFGAQQAPLHDRAS